APPPIHTLSLHDALPIYGGRHQPLVQCGYDLPFNTQPCHVVCNTGCQRRWLGPLRRTGKVPSDRRVADTGLRQGLAGTAPPAERNELVLLRDRAVEI